MARELTPALKEQQRWGLISWPYVRARITKKWGGVIRYDFDNLYSGDEDDGDHCAAMPGDGSLIRLRVTLAATSHQLHYQRVTNPNPESDFSAWTYLNIYNVLGVASCAYGANVSQFYINTDREINHRESTDNGANWGNWSILGYAPTTSINGVAAAYKSNGDICLVWNDVNVLYRMRRTAGEWEERASNPNALATKTGIAIYHHQDWNIVATYAATDAAKGIAICILGDGYSQPADTWSDWDNIITRGSTEPYIYKAPFVLRPDTTRLYFVENFTQEEVQNHIWYSHMPPSADFEDNAWLEPLPTEPQSDYGLAITYLGSYAWLTNANKVFRALATEDALDLTARLLEIDSRDYPDIFKGSLKVAIDNTGGWYNAFDRLGQQLEVGIGYKTPAGDEYSLMPFRWITKFKLVAPPWYPLRMIFPVGVIGTLQIETEDAWVFLYRYRTRRTLSWAAGEKSVKELLQFFIARCGLDFEVVSASAAATYFKPAFEVRTRTSYRTAIKNLLKMVPDQLVFREAKVLLKSPGGPTIKHMQILRPNEIGSETAIAFQFPSETQHWDKVDEETPDEDATYIYTDDYLYDRDLYALPDPTHGGTITQVEVFVRFRNTQTSFNVGAQASIRTHDNTYDGDEHWTKSMDYQTISHVWATNPFTDDPWTWAEIDALQAGVRLWGGAAENYVRCTQVYVEVTYWIDPPIDWTYHNLIGYALLVFRGKYGISAWDPNRAEVWGDTFMKQAAEWPQVQMVRDRLSRVATPTYPNLARAGERALAELRRSEILKGEESWMNAPTNCGLEAWDKLQITDTVGGVTNILRRVIRVKTYWNKRHWQYNQVMTLGAD